MKKIIFVIITMFTIIPFVSAGGYNMQIPVEGNSIADDKLQFNVMRDIYKELAPQNPYCFDYSVSDTQIVQYPYDVKKKDGKYKKAKWQELWTINACSNKIQVPVFYTIRNDSAAYKIETDFFTQ